jgi:hypothetical protein
VIINPQKKGATIADCAAEAKEIQFFGCCVPRLQKRLKQP